MGPVLRAPLLALAALSLGSLVPVHARADEARTVPGSTWMRYADPAQAGWSAEKLERARAFWETLDSAAWMVVEDGVVVVAWGDVERRYMCHSVRKSFLSGLFGPHVDAGTIDTEKTLAELGIDDEPKLTDVERSARIEDLLRARSGVYKLAAYEPPNNPKPERGAYAPGEHWCYNNFDFNTLCTIFEQETGRRVFEEFDRLFAAPLGMQDYRVRDGYYHYELDKSIHPAYPFRLSARDSARFGLLYLYGGAWGEGRILSEEWVRRSTRSYSETGRPGGGYGYMWWTFEDPAVPGLSGYTALGVGGQAIVVLPHAHLVVVNRTDTYARRHVSDEQRNELIALVLAARAGDRTREPELVPLAPHTEAPTLPSLTAFADYAGEYDMEGDRAPVRLAGNQLLLDVPAGVFALLPVDSADGPGTFLVEDMELYLHIAEPAKGETGTARTERALRDQFAARLAEGDPEGAQTLAEEALSLFPMSPTAHAMLGRTFLHTGDPELATNLAEAALEIDPNHTDARTLAREIARQR